MAVTFTWSVTTANYTLNPDGTPLAVVSLFWQCTAEENNARDYAYGEVSVPPEDAASDPANATDEASMVAAVQRLVDQQAIEDRLTAQLAVAATPTTAQGRIWDVPVGTPVWMAGVDYAVDDVALYESTPWTCIQAHTSQAGWMPPTVPALWSIQNQGGDDPALWVAGESVAIGDQRIYLSITYECIQAHTTQAGWEPPNVPALWSVVA